MSSEGGGGAFTLVSDGMHVGMSGTFCVAISGPCPSSIIPKISQRSKNGLFPRHQSEEWKGNYLNGADRHRYSLGSE